MPIYLYKCPECGFSCEILQSALAPNPECNNCEIAMARIPCVPGVQFKGSGFHKTDYPGGKSE